MGKRNERLESATRVQATGCVDRSVLEWNELLGGERDESDGE